jgi:hypothetical protein
MRTRLITALILLITLAIGTSVPAAAAKNGYKAFFGPIAVNGHSQFPIYHKLGVQIFQIYMSWASVAPTRPQSPLDPRDPAYHWPADVQAGIDAATKNHMRVMLEIAYSPPWANGGRAANYPPKRASDFAAFATAAARRYRRVHLWLIWGEPNRRPNWGSLIPASPTAHSLTRAQAATPHKYAQILDASYAALKRVGKRNMVIGGNTFTTGDIATRLWIENLRLPNGRPPRMDFYGHNPFCWRAPNLANRPSPDGEFDFSDLGRLSRLVQRYLAPRHHRIKLYLSEWTIPTSPHDDEFNYYVTRKLQAQWITDAWRIVRHSRFIYALGWIHLYDDPPGTNGSSGGLLTSKGVPKPGYYAFKAG